jgi:hypothetical protein
MPDPRIRADGTPDFGSYRFHFDTLPAAVQAGCGQILNPLPGEATTGAPLSNADFRKLLRFSACMRRHGIPGWPDPNPEGVFTLSPQIRAGGKGLIEAPLHACERYNTNPQGGINAVEGP